MEMLFLERMKVVYFHRKPRRENYSIEGVFKNVRNNLPTEVQWEVKELSCLSNGILRRLYISLEAALYQKGINHITGDVNFIAIFLSRKRTVLTMHDIGFMNHPKRLKRFFLYWFWLVFPIRCATITTTVSIATKKEIERYLKREMASIKVIYVPISPAFSSSPKAFNKNEPVILQIGTKDNKNVHRLIRALQGIRCKLDIIGSLDDALLKELTECKINFESSKGLSEAEVVEKYRRADIVVFVSTYEGFGMPIVEANTVGRVVVTSNILSMPEIAGNAAHLVDPFDINSIRAGIVKVIEDDEYREQLIANGFLNKNRFNAEKIAEQYTAIYRTLE